MEAPGAPSTATLSRPMPAKSRRKQAAPTPRSRGDPAPVPRSPGAHGSRQLLRCPRKPTKRCGSVRSFFLGENIRDVDHWIRLLYCSLYSRPTWHTKRENRAHFGARNTPVCTLLATARDMALGRCVLLLLLLYIAPAAAVVLRLLPRLLLLLLLQTAERV